MCTTDEYVADCHFSDYCMRFFQKLLVVRGWTGGYPIPTSLPLSPHFPPSLPLSLTSLPLQPHFPPTVRCFPPPDKILFLFTNLSVAKNQNYFQKIAYQRPICIFRGQRVKTYLSLFVFMLNPSGKSGREDNDRRN